MKVVKEVKKIGLKKLGNKNLYVLIIGDSGAILVYFKDFKVESRIYLQDYSQEYIDQFIQLIGQDKKAPIYILLDTIDQTYNLQSLPAVNAFSINSLVKKRLEREFPEDILKGSMFIDRATTGRKDWNYLFIGAPLNPTILNWINLIVNLPNELKSILLLPVEAQNLIKLYNQKNYDKTSKPPTIQLLVLHTKVSGIRQVVIRNGKIIFTRLISNGEQEYEDVIAGQFEQEIVNTIQFINRNSNKENDNIEVIVVCSTDIKKFLAKNNNYKTFTPYEIAKFLDINSNVLGSDRFVDVVMASLVAFEPNILPLHIKKTKLLYFFHEAIKYSKLISAFVFSLIIVIIVNYFITTQTYNQQIDINQIQLAEFLNKIETRKKQSRINEEDSIIIKEVTKLYKSLTTTNISPLQAFNKFYKASKNNVIVKSFEWKLENAANNLTGNQPNPNPVLLPNNVRSVSNFSIKFTNTGSSYQELFANFEKYIKDLEKEFSDYIVEYTRINQQITFQEQTQEIPVSITIKGPNK
ncbi:MAG: hypothetical protein J0H68_06840 [Sphingobacteriia bacterium]|nr:hypothetical protein [Sphingobacteriia bacterium]